MNLILALAVFISAASCALYNYKYSPMLQDLKEDNILRIAEYFICPQRELGLLSKEFYRIFFNDHPYHKILAQRLNIPELLAAKGLDGLTALGKLSHVKDPIHLFKIISNGFLLSRHLYGMNLGDVIRYVDRAYREFVSNPIEISDRNEQEQSFYAKIIMDIKEYDLLIEYMIMYPHSVKTLFTYMNITTGRVLMRIIMNPSESLRVKLERVFGSVSDLSSKVYRHCYMLLTSQTERINFIICGVVANVSEELFLDLISTNDSGIRNSFLNTIFTIAAIFESPEETRRIHDTLVQIIDRIPETESVRLYSLLNLIRFGSSAVDYEHCERECREMKLSTRRIFDVMLAAALAKHHNVVVGLYQSFMAKINGFLFFDIANSKLTGIYVYICVLSGVDEPRRQTLLRSFFVFNTFLVYYDVYNFKYDEVTTKYLLSMRLKTDMPIESGVGLPETFEYNRNLQRGDDELFKSLIKKVMFKSSNHSEESLLAIIFGLAEFDVTQRLLNSDILIEASVEVMQAISGNNQLLGIVQSYNLKFELTKVDQKAKLFRRPVANLAGILTGVSPRDTISSFDSNDQFRNYEEFLNRNIADIFIAEIIPYFVEYGFHEDSFYTYRQALLYWLKGPHRSRLSELVPTYAGLLQKLALEVESTDSNFLLGAIEQNNTLI